jgi:hypothetical protein
MLASALLMTLVALPPTWRDFKIGMTTQEFVAAVGKASMEPQACEVPKLSIKQRTAGVAPLMVRDGQSRAPVRVRRFELPEEHRVEICGGQKEGSLSLTGLFVDGTVLELEVALSQPARCRRGGW